MNLKIVIFQSWILHYDLFALKKELVDLTKTTTVEPKEVEEIKSTKKEEQLSFDAFIDDFKI